MEQVLKRGSDVGLRLRLIRPAELATHAIVTIVLATVSGATMRIRKASTAESEHRELYQLLGVDEKIVSPKTIWSETGDYE